LSTVYKYNNHFLDRIPFEDFVSAGSEGLWNAIDKYDTKYKTKLSTYSIPWIKLKILDLINDFNSPVYTPINIVAKSHKYKKFKGEDKNINDQEMMDKLDVTEKQLLRIKLSEYKTVLLNAPISNHNEEISIIDTIADTSVIKVDSILYTKEVRDIIKNAINKLKPIQQEVITSRYLKEDKENLNDIGHRLGITGERVRQIEVTTLRLLKKRMKSRAKFNI
jgi:RNA polymerase sigma factor (sigma-70 family)